MISVLASVLSLFLIQESVSKQKFSSIKINSKIKKAENIFYLKSTLNQVSLPDW